MQQTADDLDVPYPGLPADVIPLQYHVPMLLDQHRMDAFQQAIAEVVRPGMHVLDLGAGTGVLACFAARQGARVTAVEREPIVLAAARTALAQAGAHQVTLVHADARDYVPSEPVDLVICEMMHVGQLRERQIEVIGGLKRRYRAAFGDRLPRFLPEACVQAAQPVQQDFTFHGYAVAAPQFQDPFADQPRTVELAGPQVFQQFFYADELPDRCAADLEFTVARPGRLNAVRIITKNVLVAHAMPPRTVDWLMNYLVVPLAAPVDTQQGDRILVRFDYRPGDQIHVLAATAQATVLPRSPGRSAG
ncbi:MAG TPA: methyltransferase domain-containing protein [Actinoplanes sp.]|nr:methyltransferase domain-containing protein [Actinoplanes sp.]